MQRKKIHFGILYGKLESASHQSFELGNTKEMKNRHRVENTSLNENNKKLNCYNFEFVPSFGKECCEIVSIVSFTKKTV